MNPSQTKFSLVSFLKPQVYFWDFWERSEIHRILLSKYKQFLIAVHFAPTVGYPPPERFTAFHRFSSIVLQESPWIHTMATVFLQCQEVLTGPGANVIILSEHITQQLIGPSWETGETAALETRGCFVIKASFRLQPDLT